jgi:hypothetical protein
LQLVGKIIGKPVPGRQDQQQKYMRKSFHILPPFSYW